MSVTEHHVGYILSVKPYIYLIFYLQTLEIISHRIHVWYIYLHLVNVGKYTIHGSYGYEHTLPESSSIKIIDLIFHTVLQQGKLIRPKDFFDR